MPCSSEKKYPLENEIPKRKDDGRKNTSTTFLSYIEWEIRMKVTKKRSKHFKNEDKCNLFFKRNFQQDVPNRQTPLGFIMIHREKKLGCKCNT